MGIFLTGWKTYGCAGTINGMEHEEENVQNTSFFIGAG